jgi:hypothetical protein
MLHFLEAVFTMALGEFPGDELPTHRSELTNSK